MGFSEKKDAAPSSHGALRSTMMWHPSLWICHLLIFLCFLPGICEALLSYDLKVSPIPGGGSRHCTCRDTSTSIRALPIRRASRLSGARPFSLQPLWGARRTGKPGLSKQSPRRKPTEDSVKRGRPSSTKSERRDSNRPSIAASGQPEFAEHRPPSPPRKKATTAPPWQVLSDKDAKKNIVQELERRKLIQQGLKPSHEGRSDDTSSRATLSSSFLSSIEQRFLKWKPFQPSSVSLQMRWVGAYLDKKLPPRLGVPEVAFLGRSNVGKSSLLNRLSKLVGSASAVQARVGKTPGATASVNLYALRDIRSDRDVLGFTDLPGFGYAKLSKDVQDAVQVAAEQYLSQRKELALGILLVDIRRTPSDDDRAVLAALYDMGVPLLAVATKLDKVHSPAERERCLTEIRNGLGLPTNQPLAVSSVTGEGCRTLWQIVMEACETSVNEVGAKYRVSAATTVETSEAMPPLGTGASPDEDDDDDILYSQGYDWIHDDTEDGGGVMYDEDDDDEQDMPPTIEEESIVQPARESLRSLKTKARDMLRKGTV